MKHIPQYHVQSLIASLRNHDAVVRRRAAFTLGDLQAEEATRALQDALRDSDEQVRKAAIHALDELDPGMSTRRAA